MKKYYADFNSDPLFFNGEANKKTVKAQIANNNALLQQQKKGGNGTVGNMSKLNNKNQYGIASTLASNQSKQSTTLGNGNSGGYSYDPKTGQTIRWTSVLTRSNGQGIMKADRKALHQALFKESEDVLGRLFLDGLEGRETPKYLLQSILQKEEKQGEMSDELGYAFLEGFNYNDEDALRELEREKNRGIFATIEQKADELKKDIELGQRFNDTVDKQYPRWSGNAVNAIGSVTDKRLPQLFYSWSDNIIEPMGAVADARLAKSLYDVKDNEETIKRVANELHIPKEVIGSVILKEQYTKDWPDVVANATTWAGVTSGLYELEDGYTGSKVGIHSVGFGAVRPDTAREAWEWFLGDEKAVAEILPKDNLQLQYKLSRDDIFNIETTGVVLAHKAYLLGIIDKPEDIWKLENLSYEDWQKVCKKYNGTGNRAQKYSEYVREYFADMKEYLE